MRYCVINGSPRGKSGNTEILLRMVMDGIESTDNAVEITECHLNTEKERQFSREAFGKAEVVLLGFPLYTDAMPGLVKEFIESLQPDVGRDNNPKMAFLVQSGFPEAYHSRFVERYLEKLARRLNAPYAGTIVKGGCEGVRLMPEEMNRKLFEGLRELGTDLAREGVFNPERLTRLAKPEQFPRFLTPLFWLILKIPATQIYWNGLLKNNNAYQDRFARPFER